MFKDALLRPVFQKMSYEERLFRLGLQTLELRRIMTDLITCYKLINGEHGIDCDSLISVSTFK